MCRKCTATNKNRAVNGNALELIHIFFIYLLYSLLGYLYRSWRHLWKVLSRASKTDEYSTD